MKATLYLDGTPIQTYENVVMMKAGDKIKVKVGGVEYDTVIDGNGVQRFLENKLHRHLVDTHQVDLNRLAIEYDCGRFGQREYAEFMMSIGYSVYGFAELSAFEDMEIENPLWEKQK